VLKLQSLNEFRGRGILFLEHWTKIYTVLIYISLKYFYLARMHYIDRQ